MNQKNKKLHWLAQGFYLLGAVTLLASLALGLVALPVGAANAPVLTSSQAQQGGGQNAGHCLSGSVIKDENGSDGWSITAPTGQVFTTVAVKAGSEQSGGGCFTTTSNGTISVGGQACYSVSGIGTGTVVVIQLDQSNICKGISHIEGIYADPPTMTPSPTTATPEPTEVTPSPTTPSPEPTQVTPSPTTPSPEPTQVTPSPTTPSPEPTQVTVLPPEGTSTPTPSETPVTATAIVPPTGGTPTPDPGQPTQPTTPPTLPPPSPPSGGQPGLLIPVTGADQTQTHHLMISFLAFLGVAFLGLGMLTQSAARRAENIIRH